MSLFGFLRYFAWTILSVAAASGLPQCSPLVLASPQSLKSSDYAAIKPRLDTLRAELECGAALTSPEAPTSMDISVLSTAREYLSLALPVAPFVLFDAIQESAREPQQLTQLEYLNGGEFGRVFEVHYKNAKRAVKAYYAKVPIEAVSTAYVFQEVLGILGVTPKLRGVVVGDSLIPVQEMFQHFNLDPTSIAIVTDLVEEAMSPLELAGFIGQGNMSKLETDEISFLRERQRYFYQVFKALDIIPYDEQALVAFDDEDRLQFWLVDVDSYFGVSNDTFWAMKSFSKTEKQEFSIRHLNWQEVVSKIERPWSDRHRPADVDSELGLLINTSKD